MKGLTTLAELQARLQEVETDLAVVDSVLQDLQVTGPSGPASPTPSPSPPGDAGTAAGGAPLAPFYGSLTEFVDEGFAPVYCRTTSPSLRWCPCWWDHAEAIYRLEALWRSWELYRLEPRLGIASWLRDYLDPQLRDLTSPTGPFAACTDDRHAPGKPLRTQAPPPDYFDV